MSIPVSKPATSHPTDEWTIYFHRSDDTNWDTKSYVIVGKFKTIEQCWTMLNELGNDVITTCMIFIMRGDIPPKWEHYTNAAGGSYTMRINSKYAAEDFRKCLGAIIGECFAPSTDYIHGISTSPKSTHCIFKVWNRDKSCRNESALMCPVDTDHLTDGIRYVPHMDRRV